MSENKIILHDAVVCPVCGETIYSRANHDFHYCHCGATAVDGGFEYLRYMSKNLDDVKVVKVKIEASLKDLYDDWNKNKNKFGWIAPEKKKKKKK